MIDPEAAKEKAAELARHDFDQWDIERVRPQVEWRYAEFLKRMDRLEDRLAWQPIETCPSDGFFLVHEGGAIRTMFRDNGVWSSPGNPCALDQYGDRALVTGAFVSDCIYEPTHWMLLPDAP